MTIPSRLTALSGFAAMMVAGLLLAASDTATAGTVRDHRGGKDHPGAADTEGGVSANGQVVKPTTAPDVNLQGIDKGKTKGETIRDHR